MRGRSGDVAVADGPAGTGLAPRRGGSPGAHLRYGLAAVLGSDPVSGLSMSCTGRVGGAGTRGRLVSARAAGSPVASCVGCRSSTPWRGPGNGLCVAGIRARHSAREDGAGAPPESGQCIESLLAALTDPDLGLPVRVQHRASARGPYESSVRVRIGDEAGTGVLEMLGRCGNGLPAVHPSLHQAMLERINRVEQQPTGADLSGPRE